jgi:hypothetical protein
MGVIADFFARLLRMCPGRLFPGFLLIRQEVRAIFKTCNQLCCFRRSDHLLCCASLIRMRVSGECGLCGLPFLASLIFARVSGERGFPLSVSLICALCLEVNGFRGFPLRA